MRFVCGCVSHGPCRHAPPPVTLLERERGPQLPLCRCSRETGKRGTGLKEPDLLEFKASSTQRLSRRRHGTHGAHTPPSCTTGHRGGRAADRARPGETGGPGAQAAGGYGMPGCSPGRQGRAGQGRAPPPPLPQWDRSPRWKEWGARAVTGWDTVTPEPRRPGVRVPSVRSGMGTMGRGWMNLQDNRAK